MKPKSLRQLAKELGASASYLSQKIVKVLAGVNRSVNQIQATVAAGADKSRWASRTSNPLGGVSSVLGGFDSHALPPDINILPKEPEFPPTFCLTLRTESTLKSKNDGIK